MASEVHPWAMHLVRHICSSLHMIGHSNSFNIHIEFFVSPTNVTFFSRAICFHVRSRVDWGWWRLTTDRVHPYYQAACVTIEMNLGPVIEIA